MHYINLQAADYHSISMLISNLKYQCGIENSKKSVKRMRLVPNYNQGQ